MNTVSASAATLLPSVARGNVNAFEAFYDRYAPTVYALLLRILANADDAQEVLQETFVKAWTSAKMFDSVRGSEIAWLISIARSRGIDRLRSRRTRDTREDEAGREVSIHSSFLDRRTGADHAIQSEEYRAVRSALHGFVSLEHAGGFGLPVDIDRSFDRLVTAMDRALASWPRV